MWKETRCMFAPIPALQSNHYIEWPVFSDVGLNCESQGEKRRTCRKYKILIGSWVFFFLFIHDLPFSPGHPLESEGRFVNLSAILALCAPCPHGLDDWHKMSKEIVGIDIAYQPWYILNAFYVLSSTNYFAQDFLKYLMRNHFD